MQCSGGLESFGKKRRKRALVGPEMTIELTTPMGSVKTVDAAEAVEAAEAAEAAKAAEAAEDSGLSSESRKFHAQLILFLLCHNSYGNFDFEICIS